MVEIRQGEVWWADLPEPSGSAIMFISRFQSRSGIYTENPAIPCAQPFQKWGHCCWPD